MEWLRIGEVARRTGLTHRTLRHYDDLGLLVPSGRSGGDYRLYAPEDLERLLAIQHLKSLGMGLDEIGRALDDPAFSASDALAQHIAVVEGRIAAEQELLGRLQRLRSSTGWDEVLDTIAVMERLRHPDAWVRFRAALDAPTAAPLSELVEVLRSEPEPGVREVVTWAIVQHGPEALDAVVAELAHPEAGVRRQMAHVLGKMADPRGVEPLVGLLGDPDADVVAKAAFGLGQIGGVQAIGALVGALGSGGAGTRATVVTALEGLGTTVVDAVSERLDSGSAAVRADAAEVLGSIGDVRALPALAGPVADPDEDVRIAALMALGAIGGDGAGGIIRSAASAAGRTGALARRLAGGDAG